MSTFTDMALQRHHAKVISPDEFWSQNPDLVAVVDLGSEIISPNEFWSQNPHIEEWMPVDATSMKKLAENTGVGKLIGFDASTHVDIEPSGIVDLVDGLDNALTHITPQHPQHAGSNPLDSLEKAFSLMELRCFYLEEEEEEEVIEKSKELEARSGHGVDTQRELIRFEEEEEEEEGFEEHNGKVLVEFLDISSHREESSEETGILMKKVWPCPC
jgi:hypothetical protein